MRQLEKAWLNNFARQEMRLQFKTDPMYLWVTIFRQTMFGDTLEQAQLQLDVLDHGSWKTRHTGNQGKSVSSGNKTRGDTYHMVGILLLLTWQTDACCSDAAALERG